MILGRQDATILNVQAFFRLTNIIILVHISPTYLYMVDQLMIFKCLLLG